MITILFAILLATPPATAVPAPQPAAPRVPAPVVVRPAKPGRAQVVAAVRAEWPRYDAGNKGRLTPLEFSTWVMRAHGGNVAPAGVPKGKAEGIRPTSAMNASATAFARADANHDGGVTPDEMADFLVEPATTARPQPMQTVTKTAAPTSGN